MILFNCNNSSFNKEGFMKKIVLNIYCAFTLAEVLITLGIIGVVASITIPTLMQKKAEQETVGMLKKEYSVLSQAYTMAVQENGTPDNWSTDSSTMLKTLVPYLKVVKNCDTGIGCLATDYKYLNNVSIGSTDANDTSYAKAQLADGSLIATSMRSSSCAAASRGNTAALSSICGVVGIDINGLKSPNQLGRDYFFFYITKVGVIPYGTQPETTQSFTAACKDVSTYAGFGCTAWVMYNENMDYLHCNNLSWEGPTKCQ